MILEKTGIRIELTNPTDIAYHKRLGYVEVDPRGKPVKEDPKGKQEEEEV